MSGSEFVSDLKSRSGLGSESGSGFGSGSRFGTVSGSGSELILNTVRPEENGGHFDIYFLVMKARTCSENGLAPTRGQAFIPVNIIAYSLQTNKCVTRPR